MLYIGIDCGVHTGFAVWDSTSNDWVEVATLRLWKALARAKEYADKNDCTIIFEDARQRKWIPRESNESQYRGRLMGAGSVKRDAVIWEEFCKDNRIPYEAVPPIPGLTKWNEDYWQRVVDYSGKTSEHARDAALLVWGKTPIR